MRLLLITALGCICYISQSQISYSGYIDKYPVKLVTYIYSDGDARALYAYDKFDTPIRIDGRQTGNKLELFEYSDKNEVTATLKFDRFDEKSTNLTGFWVSKDSDKKLKIELKKDFDIDSDADFEEKELMQYASTADHYFKLLISKSNGDATVTGVKILEKKSDRLIQKIDLECQLWGLENISTGDFNFDSLVDFSVFEASYAGPNTSSIYILRIPGSEEYFVSEISGISLEFDEGSELIYEHNQCCAGTMHMNSVYRLENNNMVLVEQKCLVFDDESGDLIEKPCD